MTTLYYAEDVHIAQTQIRILLPISTSYRNPSSESVPICESGNVIKPEAFPWAPQTGQIGLQQSLSKITRGKRTPTL